MGALKVADRKSFFAIWPEAEAALPTPKHYKLIFIALLETEGQGIFNVL